VKEDNAIIYRSCGCSSRLVNKAFVCPEFYDSLKEETLEQKREDELLDLGSHFVTRAFLQGYEGDAGSITSRLYQQLSA